MLKKKVLTLMLAMVTMLGSSMVVQADTHTHEFIKEMYSHTYYVPASHRYLYAVYEDYTKISLL